VLARFSASKQLELLERLKRLEQAPLVERLEPLEQTSLRCVQSDGRPQSAGQTETSFPQSQILRSPTGRFERLEQSTAVERLERAAVIGEPPNRVFRSKLATSYRSPSIIRQHCLH
jgi:hypothetical protein